MWGTVVTLHSIQIQVAQQPLAQVIDPAMHDHGPVLSPCYLYDFGLAHRVHLGHDVKFTQTTPAHLFAGRAVQFVFVLSVYRAHVGEPILQRQSRPFTQAASTPPQP